MSFHDRTKTAAKGKWRGILLALGVPEASLRDKHGPCPICEHKENFRWDNREGSGSYICTCGAGDGMALAMAWTGQDFPATARQIDELLGNVKPDGIAPKPEFTDEQRRQALRGLWQASSQMVPGDLGDKYLTARGIGDTSYPASLRFGPAVKDGEGGIRPCMIAMVTGSDGKPVTMHRTFLRPDGLEKAEMAAPRKLMPGQIPDGSSIRLSEWTGGTIGVAEGIETALAASILFEMPVWAVISAGQMAKWWPPEGCEEIVIFGDNDAKFAGQAAAYQLAHRLAVKGRMASVMIPTKAGQDWNDVLRERNGK